MMIERKKDKYRRIFMLPRLEERATMNGNCAVIVAPGRSSADDSIPFFNSTQCLVLITHTRPRGYRFRGSGNRTWQTIAAYEPLQGDHTPVVLINVCEWKAT